MKYPQDFLVRVECLTYNHVNYISDAMDGFCMQQTSFPFVCTIIDDASTDGEQEVVKAYVDENFDMNDSSVFYEKEEEYGRVTFARHKTNSNCYFAVIYLKENHYSQRKSKSPYIEKWANTKYIAICEGDDYWTDPLKLQKQVYFLERHVDYSMCFHAADVKNEGKSNDSYRNGTYYSDIENREYTSTEVVSKWMVPTASIVFKKAFVDNYQIKHPEWLVYGDIVLVLKCSHTGKIFGMSDVMSVYRIQPNSVTNNAEFVDSTVFKLPNHYRSLRMNFPKVDKGPLEWCISHYSYVCMKKRTNPFLKLRDFFMFVWWDPKKAEQRIRKVLQDRMA